MQMNLRWNENKALLTECSHTDQVLTIPSPGIQMLFEIYFERMLTNTHARVPHQRYSFEKSHLGMDDKSRPFLG